MSGKPATLRLFCALRLPDSVCAEIVAWQRQALSGGRLTAAENLHMTLCFLGERPPSAIADIAAALRLAIAEGEAIAFEPRDYRETHRVGMLTFHDSAQRARALVGRLSFLLLRKGLLDAEPRRWLPHITVMAFADRPRLAPFLPALGRFAPSDAAVYSSTLHRDGARYEVLEAMGLGG